MKIFSILSLYICLVSILSCQSKHDAPINCIQLDSTLLSLHRVSSNLQVPWDLQYDHVDNAIVFSEIGGNIKKLDLITHQTTLVHKIDDVYQHRTLGLLGMALYQPDVDSCYLYVSYTSQAGESIFSNLVRYRYQGNKLAQPKSLLKIPGNTGHNGSRIIISQDKKILWATGDAAHGLYAQDTTSLNGKILRLNLDGSIPEDNPIPGSYVYAWGFRNMQGLTQSGKGYIYTSEHGDAIEDEINLIKPLQNYGWPNIEGMHDREEEKILAGEWTMTEPLKSWTPVIAPAGLAYYGSERIPEWKNSLLLTTLKNQSLRILQLSEDGQSILNESTLFSGYLGRLRAVLVLPNGDIYFCSSNRDWNPQPGFPKEHDDGIYRLRRTNKVNAPVLRTESIAQNEPLSGKVLYTSYCASCHKPLGEGLSGVFPALSNSPIVNGEKNELTRLIIQGTINREPEGSSFEGNMPAFSFLQDEEIMEITNYIRTNFGNSSPKIDLNTVKANRD